MSQVLSHLPALTQLVIAMNGIKGVSFCSLDYTNEAGEQQKTLINVGASYENAKFKDAEFLSNLTIKDLQDKAGDFTLELMLQAKNELLDALMKPSEARSAGQTNAYTHVNNGLKYHNETGELYIFGMKVKKTVITEGEYKEVKSKPLTLAKEVLRGLMKSTQYRQYKVKSTSIAKLKGDTLEFAEAAE